MDSNILFSFQFQSYTYSMTADIKLKEWIFWKMCERQERSHERRGEEMKGDEKRREPRRAEKREANKNLRL